MLSQSCGRETGGEEGGEEGGGKEGGRGGGRGGGGGDKREEVEGGKHQTWGTARNKSQPLSLFPIFLIPVLVYWLPPVHDTCPQDNKQTNKQTRTETECTRCRPHLLSYTLTTSSTVCTVWLLQNVSSRLLQLLLDGWVNEGPNLTKINTQ